MARSSVFFNCFLRIFGDGGWDGPEPPDPGCDDCGGGCTGEGCGCDDCDPGDDPCDDLVVLAECPPGNVGLCIERTYSKQQLIDAQCILDCEDPVLPNCESCALGFLPQDCATCCPSDPPPPPPTTKVCTGYICAQSPCQNSYAVGGCVVGYQVTIPIDDPCPTTWNGKTSYAKYQDALILENCYSTDPTDPTTPSDGPGGGGGGGCPGCPWPPYIGGTDPCTLYKCYIIGDGDPQGPSQTIERECLGTSQSIIGWQEQFLITSPGQITCDDVKARAVQHGYYPDKAACEPYCQDEIIYPGGGTGGGQTVDVWTCDAPGTGNCTKITVAIGNLNPDGTLVNSGKQTYSTEAACQQSPTCCVEITHYFWRCDQAGSECNCVQDVELVTCEANPDPPNNSFATQQECFDQTPCCAGGDPSDPGNPTTTQALGQLVAQYPFDEFGQPAGGIPMGYCAGDNVTIDAENPSVLSELGQSFDLVFEANATGIFFDDVTGSISISSEALATPGATFGFSVNRDCCDDELTQTVSVALDSITTQLAPTDPLCLGTGGGGGTDGGGGGGPADCGLWSCDGAPTYQCSRTLQDIDSWNAQLGSSFATCSELYANIPTDWYANQASCDTFCAAPPENCTLYKCDTSINECERIVQDIAAWNTDLGTTFISCTELYSNVPANHYRNQSECEGACGPPPDTTITCPAYICQGTACIQLPGGDAAVLIEVVQGRTCEDVIGQQYDPVGSPDGYIGYCGVNDVCNGGGGGGPTYCRVTYCDESNNCITEFADITLLSDRTTGDPLTECAQDGTIVNYQIDANTQIPAIAGGTCPPACAGGVMRTFSNEGSNGAEFSYNAVLAYRDMLENVASDDLLYDPLVEDRIFTFPSAKRVFTPIQNPGYDTHILGAYIHASVYYAYQAHTTGSLLTSFDDVGGETLLQSLHPEIQEALAHARDVAGQPLQGAVLSKIAYLIRKNKLSTLKREDLLNLHSGNQNRYGHYRRSRGSENNAIRYIDEKAKPLHHAAYTGQARDRMRVWKTVAPDVNKHIALVQRDGTVLEHPINVADEYFIQEGDGTITVHNIDDGDYFDYVDRYNKIDRGSVFSDIDRAFMLDLSDGSIVNTLLGSNNDVTLLASSIPVSKIEETADLSTAHPDSYFLVLRPDTIEDMERDHPLVRKSTCKYRWESDETAFNEWVEFKPWPYLVVYVDHEDPFLDHLEKRNNIDAIFRDVSFDYYKGYEDDYPIMPRRIPWYMIIIPTDDPSKTIQSTGSRLIDYSVRELNITMMTPLGSGGKSPMKFNPPGIVVQQAAPTEDVDKDRSRVGGVKAYSTSGTINEQVRPYSTGSEPLPRNPSSFRNFMEAVRDVYDTSTFIDQETNAASWGDVYKRMSTVDRNTIKRDDIKKWNGLKEGFARGNPTPSEVLNAELPRLYRVPPQDIRRAEDFVTPTVTVRKLTVDPDEETPTPI